MRGGIIAIGLHEATRWSACASPRKGDQMLIASKDGYAICFSSEDARPMGRPAAGRARHEAARRATRW
jgi:DNA gyrase/topoisomerase IV subunit A